MFTATFNRGDTLQRTFDSISAQTDRDFEWVIVDDGSKDDTRQRVESWMQTASFRIQYSWQENRGRHTAINAGVRLARGELFVNIDSDDELLPDALAQFRDAWNAIPEGAKARYAGLAALCIDESGRLVGSSFPSSPLDCPAHEMRLVHKVAGEKILVRRTDVLREHPFPEPEGVKYIPPGYAWADIDKKYLTRHINKNCRVYWRNWGGERQITHSRDMSRQAPGYVMWHAKMLNDRELRRYLTPLRLFLSAARFSRFSFHMGLSPVKQARTLETNVTRAIWIVAFPFGTALWMRDRLLAHRYRPR